MGSCFSKKNVCASSPPPVSLPDPPGKPKPETQLEKKEETVVKKEIFIIKHRKNHEVERQRSEEEKGEVKKVEIVEKDKNLSSGVGGGGAQVRTSSCTKEEVDAILIQCGRLSRSTSTGKAALSSENGGRKYSGSKRSYDFDNENGKCGDNGDGDDEAVAAERENRRRERNQQPQGRRRTPSREREQAAQRSGSRERGTSGGGRRVSISPGRRSESPITTNTNSAAANVSCRPGKMVSVPATVAVDKAANSGGGCGGEAGAKKIQVKKNVGGEGGVGTRSAASPRARSPARLRAAANEPPPMSLSRSNSRKAEVSPFRRNPLSEIDNNIISQNNKTAENKMNSSSNVKNQEQHQAVGSNVIPENLKTTRSRSSRLSRDLDINLETQSNPNTSYTALLLEDIHNFHQKNTTPSPPPPAFSLPPCVTKACSILEAVADLNSSTGSNLSTTNLRRNPNIIKDQVNKTKAKQELRDPILESEIVAADDLMQPSFHKYVTVRRGTAAEDLEEQESSGSNSFAGSQQHWASASCWEPNSAESTDRLTSSSRSNNRQNEVNPVGYQRHPTSDDGGKMVSAAKKRDGDHQQSGNGKGRIANRVSHMVPVAAST